MIRQYRKSLIGEILMLKSLVILTISIAIAISVYVYVDFSNDPSPTPQENTDTVGIERDGATLPDF